MTLFKSRPLEAVGAALIAMLVLPVTVSAQDELLSEPPEERSTPESIRFDPVDEEQLGNTSIEGALGPTAAGLASGNVDTLVEPVYLSDQLRRSLDMEKEELQRQREQLVSPSSIPQAPQPMQVQRPTYENRSYSPSSRSTSTFRE